MATGTGSSGPLIANKTSLDELLSIMPFVTQKSYDATRKFALKQLRQSPDIRMFMLQAEVACFALGYEQALKENRDRP